MTVPEGAPGQDRQVAEQIVEGVDLGETSEQIDPGIFIRAGRRVAGLAISVCLAATELGYHIPLTALKGRHAAEELDDQESAA